MIWVECRRKGSLHYYLADMICMTGNHEISHVFGVVFFYPLKEIFACKIDSVEQRWGKRNKPALELWKINHSTFLTLVCKLGHSDVICYCKVWIFAITFWTSIATLVTSVHARQTTPNWGGEKTKQTSFRIVENRSQHFSDNCLQIR